MRREIVQWGDPVLEKKTGPVTEFGPGLRALVRDMLDTMRAVDGVGLSANQVGIRLSVCVLSTTYTGGPEVMVNPRIIQVCNESEKGSEGCLSLAGFFYRTSRPKSVVARYQDI